MPLFTVVGLSLLHGPLWVNFASSSSQLPSLVKSILFEGSMPVLICIGSLLIGQCISTQIGYRSTPFPQLHILCQVHRFLPPTVRFRHQMSVEIQEEMLSRFQRLTSILSQGHRYGRNGPK